MSSQAYTFIREIGEREGRTEGGEREQKGEREGGGRDDDVKVEAEINVATSRGMTAATRNWKKQGSDSPLEMPERARPCQQHLDFSPVILIRGICPP